MVHRNDNLSQTPFLVIPTGALLLLIICAKGKEDAKTLVQAFLFLGPSHIF